MSLLLLLFACVVPFATAADSAGSIAPKIFSGWDLQKSMVVTEAAQVDPLYADLLKEYGLVEAETAQYTKPGRTLSVKIARFHDASGAFGAFHFYRGQMAPEDIGDMAASNNERILFLTSNLLVDAKFDRITPMSGGELRELASLLPKQTGNTANLPSVTTYLPKQGMVENSTRYVFGPVGLSRLPGAPPAEQVDFSTGAEIASAQYKTGKGVANLFLISYPTPGVAGLRLRSIEQWHPSSTDQAGASVWSKRSGPLVAVVTGSISDGEAKTLLASVNYDADVTWNQDTGLNPRNNLGNLLVNIIVLIAILFGLAIVAGIAFGGLRILVKRMFPDRVFDRKDDIEIIRLNIRD
ncbi:MAG TPA: DUF6599 family protein [Terriglobales bacterium]|nr:DUF6599 family protein [Terriglobales bacterium]